MKRKILFLVSIFLILISASIFSAGNKQTIQTIEKKVFLNTVKSNVNDFTHTVFCEQGSATWCPYCPRAAEALYNIYSSAKYPFYYVSLIYDKNEKAKERLSEDYNLKGFPTCFFDGGYEVLYGGYSGDEPYENKIISAGERNVANVDIALNADWVMGCCNKVVFCEITILNNEESEYNGFLRVYLTEINSRWYDYDGNPYHFGFLDFIANTEISIPAREKLKLTYEWDPAASNFPDVDPSNLMVIAVLFNSEEHQGYADPPDNTHPFTAYYVDDAIGDIVLEGNLPPEIGIIKPKEGYLYLFNKPVGRAPFRKTILIGKIDVEVYANDDRGIEKVEFYIDDELKKEIYEEPYSWTLDFPLIGRYQLKVTAYDTEGKSSSSRINIIAFII
jgi:thiol-disulfide isomerase/thioredoxin